MRHQRFFLGLPIYKSFARAPRAKVVHRRCKEGTKPPASPGRIGPTETNTHRRKKQKMGRSPLRKYTTQARQRWWIFDLTSRYMVPGDCRSQDHNRRGSAQFVAKLQQFDVVRMPARSTRIRAPMWRLNCSHRRTDGCNSAFADQTLLHVCNKTKVYPRHHTAVCGQKLQSVVCLSRFVAFHFWKEEVPQMGNKYL